MKASDLFVKALENEGVEYVFGVPGEENLDLVESLQNSPIELIICRHEQAAGFMAATYGRLTGKPGVCLSTVGPGATNLVTAAAYALLGGMPMLMITGQKPIKSSKQGHFQVIKTTEMMTPLTQYSAQIVNGNRIPSMVREVFKVASNERPGPVHLELPEDIAAEETENDIVFDVKHIRRPVAEEKAVRTAIEMIEQAKHPLLLVGAGANRKRASKALSQFVSETGIPFFNTQMGKGVVDEHHELYLGTAALSENDYLHCGVDKADLIINVGHDVIEKPPFIMHHNGRNVIHVNFFPADVDDVYFPQHEVVGDISDTIKAFNTRIKKQSHWDFSYYKKVKDQIERHIHEGETSDAFPIIPQRLVHDVHAVMPEDGIVALDNGMYKIWFARNFKVSHSNGLLLDNALASMGAGLPSAIAAKMVSPKKKVLAVTGDGGFMMNSQELETAVRLKLDLTVVILNDNAFGMIKWKQRAMKFEDYGLDYTNPDFVAYAESYGAHGHRIQKADELRSILEYALNASGVHVIEVPIDYSENEKVLTRELEEKTCIVE